MTVQVRLLHGIIHVDIAAYAYPTPASLLDEDVRVVSVQAVERFLLPTAARPARPSKLEDPPDSRTNAPVAGGGRWPLPARQILDQPKEDEGVAAVPPFCRVCSVRSVVQMMVVVALTTAVAALVVVLLTRKRIGGDLASLP